MTSMALIESRAVEMSTDDQQPYRAVEVSTDDQQPEGSRDEY